MTTTIKKASMLHATTLLLMHWNNKKLKTLKTKKQTTFKDIQAATFKVQHMIPYNKCDY